MDSYTVLLKKVDHDYENIKMNELKKTGML